MAKPQGPYRETVSSGAFEPGFVRPGSLADQFLSYHRSLEQLVMDVEREVKMIEGLAEARASSVYTRPCLARLNASVDRIKLLGGQS